MKIVILYHPRSDHSREVEEYVHEFIIRNPEVTIEAISLETREGADMATLYGVMKYPCMMTLRDDGVQTKSWEGLPFPLMNEVAYYAIA